MGDEWELNGSWSNKSMKNLPEKCELDIGRSREKDLIFLGFGLINVNNSLFHSWIIYICFRYL